MSVTSERLKRALEASLTGIRPQGKVSNKDVELEDEEMVYSERF